ncbi:sporulation protein [Streptomyces sp. NPDC005529]|uniref:sporulation protein n=1 Tax=unclassified Streptomyces TaxID=2593676 RepID=UPI0033BB4D37
MPGVEETAELIGLNFPRDSHDAVHTATRFWSTVERRTFFTGAFAVGAYATPVTRWLAVPADPQAEHHGGHHVGRQDLDELWAAADDARRWDQKYGGGTWKSSSVVACLHERAVPLLHGTYTDAVGRQLFAVTAELARIAGWSALDMGHHDVAQRHFIQALRMARAGGSMDIGCHVLTTAALQTILRGYPNEAVDMAQGAYERARHQAAPRVLAFAKLIEARAHARLDDGKAAGAALAVSERLLEQADTAAGDEPAWIGYYTPGRMAADAVEIHRDLGSPDAALRWNNRAVAMSPSDFTRSVGLRMTVLATIHLQKGDLDQALDHGQRAISVLSRVQSARANDYVTDVVRAMVPWRRDPRVRDLSRRARAQHTASSEA